MVISGPGEVPESGREKFFRLVLRWAYRIKSARIYEDASTVKQYVGEIKVGFQRAFRGTGV